MNFELFFRKLNHHNLKDLIKIKQNTMDFQFEKPIQFFNCQKPFVFQENVSK